MRTRGVTSANQPVEFYSEPGSFVQDFSHAEILIRMPLSLRNGRRFSSAFLHLTTVQVPALALQHVHVEVVLVGGVAAG